MRLDYTRQLRPVRKFRDMGIEHDIVKEPGQSEPRQSFGLGYDQMVEGACGYTERYIHECVVVVGLPARGKSYISKMLHRYMNWRGIETKIFNIGTKRRSLVSHQMADHTFFDPGNQSFVKIRTDIAVELFNELSAWLTEKEDRVGIFDGTNTALSMRDCIRRLCAERGIRPFFIELINNNETQLARNVKAFAEKSQDYAHVDPQTAVDDLLKRIDMYRKDYATMTLDTEADSSFIQIYNAGEFHVVNNIIGPLQARIVYYLVNTHNEHRKLYFTRHGESLHNEQNKIGGDSSLSDRGVRYAKKLAQLIKKLDIADLQVWTSDLRRTIETSIYLPYKPISWAQLNEIESGICDSMTYSEIAEKYPDEFEERLNDKYNYRYPRGESYHDLVKRLDPMILQLERSENVLVISHQAVLRCLLAYFCEMKSEKTPYVNVPLHTLFEVSPGPYGCEVVSYRINVDDNQDLHLFEKKTLSKNMLMFSDSMQLGPSTDSPNNFK